MRIFFHLVYLWATAGAMFIGLQVYLLDRTSRVNRIFALLCLVMTYWAFCEAEFYSSVDAESARFWLKCLAFWPIASSVLLHFSLVYTGYDRYLKKWGIALLVYLPSIFVISSVQLDGGYQLSETMMYWGWNYSLPSSNLLVLESFILISLNAVGLALCFFAYLRLEKGVRKQQVGLVAIGLSIPFLTGIVAHGLQPALDIMLPELSILGFVIGTGTFTGYAVWKYKLFEITPATTAENIIATMPEALLLVDANGDILTINESARSMLDYERHELIGHPASTILARNYDDIEAIDSYKPGKDYKETITSLKTKGGSLIPVSILKTSIKDATGNLAGSVLIASDITERMDAKHELNMKDEEFRALVENSKDTIIRFDRKRRITYANRAFLEKFDLEKHSLLGKTCIQSGLPANIAKSWESALKEVVNTGSEKTLDVQRPGSNTGCCFIDRLTPEFDENNQVVSVLVVSRDITEHVRSETALREMEKRYRLFFDQSTDVLVHLDRNSQIVDVNRRALEITGLKREDLVGKRITALSFIFTRTSVARMAMAFANRTAGVDIRPYEVEAHVAGGRTMFFEIGATPLTDSEGSIIGEFAVLHDVTDRKKGEDKVLLQSKALAQRTEELAGLFQISSTISNTLEMDMLLDRALEEIMTMKNMDLKPECGIFILEGDRLRLVTSKNVSDNFKRAHLDLKKGQCLCGIAAREGQILVSRNCNYDTRHTISYNGMKSHGDVIVPLTAPDGICGVMFLHKEANVTVTERDLELLRSIGNQLGIAIKNSLLFEETKTLSLHDPLTGLANRNLMDIELQKMLARSRRSNIHLSLVMIDLDHFKQFNDTYGHVTGDMLLAEIAGIFKSEIREVDLAVRYGGEEFLLLLPDASNKFAEKAAERIRNKVETTGFPVTDDEVAHITISLGIATSLDGSENPDILIARADTALYLAKERGRNRVELWIS